MTELDNWRVRHKAIKNELLKLSNKIAEAKYPEDVTFYQEICERYAYHLKKIENSCHEEIGVYLCNCSFNDKQCDYTI
ncbi:hypothetical protein [Paenibacillus piscarius]|uniref:hypothetical protein n=1 Tax=Paenibacillus piscarius TaxID=1089681 RepID=UPI001EE7E97B|nr:hypothetical protein [Paenibacillus piscarius]